MKNTVAYDCYEPIDNTITDALRNSLKGGVSLQECRRVGRFIERMKAKSLESDKLEASKLTVLDHRLAIDCILLEHAHYSTIMLVYAVPGLSQAQCFEIGDAYVKGGWTVGYEISGQIRISSALDIEAVSWMPISMETYISGELPFAWGVRVRYGSADHKREREHDIIRRFVQYIELKTTF